MHQSLKPKKSFEHEFDGWLSACCGFSSVSASYHLSGEQDRFGTSGLRAGFPPVYELQRQAPWQSGPFSALMLDQLDLCQVTEEGLPFHSLIFARVQKAGFEGLLPQAFGLKVIPRLRMHREKHS